MWPFRRRRAEALAAVPAVDLWYPGIELRISTRDGEIMRVTSTDLHYAAKYESFAQRPPGGCDPGCMPGCDRHGWLSLMAGVATEFAEPPPGGEFSTVPIKIEVKPLRLGGRRELAEAARDA